MPSFYEFFAGGGMVRAGLGNEWDCLFANDFDIKKSHTYKKNWGANELLTGDIRLVTSADLPGMANLAWASFPCQDLSLAGAGAGLKGDRSGTFRPFWKLMTSLVADGRGPQLIVLENVCGALTSHGGKDFSTICEGFHQIGYSVGAMVVDASLFVPQSRPRLFVIGIHNEVHLPQHLIAVGPTPPWHTKALTTAFQNLAPAVRREWLWWNPPVPPKRKHTLADVIEDNPPDSLWFNEKDTLNVLGMMSEVNLAKVQSAQKSGKRIVGCAYKRTRIDEHGLKAQRLEVRFDSISGCLRTPAGGSSRQLIITVDGNRVRARLISSRETARLMGLAEDYQLPRNYNEAYHLTGDGVVVPVVRHLSTHIFNPVLESITNESTTAA